MNDTQNVKRISREHAETKLEKYVARWMNSKASDYSDGVRGVYDDLMHGGCGSGYVGELIYTTDCVAFYKRFKKEISELLKEFLEETGYKSPAEIFTGRGGCMAWEAEDPLALDDTNQNLLAWFGFELSASRLANRAGIEG